MKSLVLTGINGTVAQAMKKHLEDRYEIVGLSLKRMDEVLAGGAPSTWKELLDSYRELLKTQIRDAIRGRDAIIHLGWNTRDENWKAGLDPLNILAVQCVYEAAIEENVPRIYMASSVHSYDFMGDGFDVDVPIPPYPDTRRDPFGTRPTSLYGVSKRWMEIAGQYYEPKLNPGQKVLVVRIGALSSHGRPGERFSRLWYSHPDAAGLVAAFVECDDDAPNFWVAFGISNNVDGDPPNLLFDVVNPYGFVPQDNAHVVLAAGDESS